MTVANGDRRPCLGVYTADVFTIHDKTFLSEDVILGTQCLATRPMLWNFGDLTMQFWLRDHKVVWRSLEGPAFPLMATTAGDNLLSVLLHDFADVFAEPRGLPPPRPYDHRIHLLPGTNPVAVRPYRYPALQKDELERQCRDMLDGGMIRRSTSAFSSPILLVKKADVSWRFCVDYRALNEQTVRDSFPISVVDELLNELYGAQFFTKLDLHLGYHQVRMCATDVHKTVFRTHDGLYKFLVFPFGLTNAPTTFQALMNDTFLRRFVLVFFNGILIYNTSWTDDDTTEHLHHVHSVFSALCRYGLVLKQSKCSFGESSVAYLGHIISHDGVAMDAGKVQAVVDWPVPRLVRALCGFLGLTGYYRKYVKDYRAIATPLTNLLCKDSFTWLTNATEAFHRLKTALTTAPILTLLDFERPCMVECDAYGIGFGGILHQEQGHCPLAPQHHGLAAYEWELIGLIQAVCRWRPYLWGQHFLVKMDHYSLKFLLDQQLATLPQHHWVSKLLGFDFSVEYKPGRLKVVADALSRHDADLCVLPSLFGPMFDIIDDLRRAASGDLVLVSMSEQVAAGTLGKPWSLVDGVMLYDGKLYLPPDSDLLRTILAGVHNAAHEGIEKTLHRFRHDFHTPRERACPQQFVLVQALGYEVTYEFSLPFSIRRSDRRCEQSHWDVLALLHQRQTTTVAQLASGAEYVYNTSFYSAVEVV
ncbi:LOW QUALITY PROTEIN: hypothetical protein U9M48_038979, partial [Paspalum notatum var. saurae]